MPIVVKTTAYCWGVC